MADSAGPTPDTSSPTTGSAGRSVAPGSCARPAARRARDDRMASAPAMSVTDSRPPAMSEAARLTSHWGDVPPMVDTSRTGASTPTRPANSDAGAGPARVMTLTTDRRSIAPRRAGAWARASSQARSIRSTGLTGSTRSMAWPEATTTGILSGSGRLPVTGSGRSSGRVGHRVTGPRRVGATGCAGAQATIAIRHG